MQAQSSPVTVLRIWYKSYLFHWPWLKLTKAPASLILSEVQYCSHSAHGETVLLSRPTRLWIQRENMLLSSLELWWNCDSPLLETEPISNIAFRGTLLNPDLSVGLTTIWIQSGLFLSGQYRLWWSVLSLSSTVFFSQQAYIHTSLFHPGPVNSSPWKPKQGDQQFTLTLGYLVCLRPACAT